MSRVIGTEAERITLISRGRWVYPNYQSSQEFNQAARYVIPFIVRRKYDLNEFVITSMVRPGDRSGSPHKKDLAVDFYVKPLSLMPVVFNDLASVFSGGNVYIGAPINGGSVARHIHFDFDAANHKDYKAIEIEETNTTGNLGQINAQTAPMILRWYGLPATAENIGALMSRGQGGLVKTPDTTRPQVVALDWVPNAIGIALVLGGGYCMYKLMKQPKRRNRIVMNPAGA